MKKVALCIIATRNYKRLLEPLLESVKKYFLTQHSLSFFIFADSADYEGWLDLDEYNVCWTQIEHLPFPLPTLFRYKQFLKKQKELSSFDYIFYCDADVRFVGEVGNEMLGKGITAIEHPTAPFGDMREDLRVGHLKKILNLWHTSHRKTKRNIGAAQYKVGYQKSI